MQYMVWCIVVVVVWFEYYQYWYVGVGLVVVEKVIVWVIEVEGFEDYMVYGYCQCVVGVLFWCQLLVVEFSDF